MSESGSGNICEYQGVTHWWVFYYSKSLGLFLDTCMARCRPLEARAAAGGLNCDTQQTAYRRTMHDINISPENARTLSLSLTCGVSE